jgi:hypothetical protein
MWRYYTTTIYSYIKDTQYDSYLYSYDIGYERRLKSGEKLKYRTKFHKFGLEYRLKSNINIFAYYEHTSKPFSNSPYTRYDGTKYNILYENVSQKKYAAGYSTTIKNQIPQIDTTYIASFGVAISRNTMELRDDVYEQMCPKNSELCDKWNTGAEIPINIELYYKLPKKLSPTNDGTNLFIKSKNLFRLNPFVGSQHKSFYNHERVHNVSLGVEFLF